MQEPLIEPLIEAWRGRGVVVIGMLHLPALPGSPGYAGDLGAVEARVLDDARTLEAGGVDGLMMENFGDVPFFKDRVPAETVACMTALACAVRRTSDLPLGINVLRNDVQSALAVAAACGASYVRVNVLAGAMITDQGLIEGRAAEVVRYRRALGATDIKVLADVDVKHAAALAPRPLSEQAEELVERAGADGLIVSGSGTGRSTDPTHLAEVKAAAGGRPVFVGSGVSEDTVPGLLPHADGLIVGTAIKASGRLDQPVEESRVQELVHAVRG